MDWFVGRCRPQKFDCVFSCNRAGWMIKPVPFHKMIGSGPVAMAVEHGSGNTSAQHSLKCFLVSLWLPISNNFFAGWVAPNVQPLLVCRPATETLKVGGISFLDALVHNGYVDLLPMLSVDLLIDTPDYSLSPSYLLWAVPEELRQSKVIRYFELTGGLDET